MNIPPATPHEHPKPPDTPSVPAPVHEAEPATPPTSNVSSLEATVSAFRDDLIRQEHRSVQIVLNLVDALRVGRSASTRRAASEAFLWWLFAPRHAIAAGVSIVGILGLYVAYRANQLLDRQNFLLESDRRSALVYELSAILDEVDEELDATEARLAASPYQTVQGLLEHVSKDLKNKDGSTAYGAINSDAAAQQVLAVHGYELYLPEDQDTAYLQPALSARLAGRIIAIDKAFRPYKYLDADGNLIPSPTSPERGQLLISLIESGIHLEHIIQKGDFAFADLQGANIASGIPSEFYLTPQLNLRSISLASAKVAQARFFHVDLTAAYFTNSDMTAATFERCRLHECDFRGALMQNTVFVDSNLTGTKLAAASVLNAVCVRCDLESAVDGCDVKDVSRDPAYGGYGTGTVLLVTSSSTRTRG